MTDTETRRIHERLDAILEAIRTLERESSTRLTTLETYRQSCREEVIGMRTALFGNGKVGLLSDVRELKSSASLQSRWFWVGILTGQGVLVATISTVIARLL
jgi:hypothetical protein